MEPNTYFQDKDSLLTLKVRNKKEWWWVYLLTDLSLKFLHHCACPLTPAGDCVKCGKNFGFEESHNGGYRLDYISDIQLNHNNMYKNAYGYSPRTITTTQYKDPLVDKVSSSTIGDMIYKYIKYKAGFSIITHKREGFSNMHVSALFLNEGGENLVETKEGKCKVCRTECRGASMRGFLVLQAELE